MEPNPRISRIRIYPVKSLDGVELGETRFTGSGSLFNDRRYAMVDEAGKKLIGKSAAAVHQLRAEFEFIDSDCLIHIREKGNDKVLSMSDDRKEIERILSGFFQKQVFIIEDMNGSLLDDPVQSQVTIVSEASIAAVASCFGIDPEDCRRRFRANIELDGVPAFWEDRLVLPGKQPFPFQIGSVEMEGIKPCPRCVVPTRDPYSGEKMPGFHERFVQLRKESLPDWSPLESYGNYYQFSVSCRVLHGGNGHSLSIGDLLSIR